MRTEHVKYQLADFVTGKLEETERKRLEVHCAGCRECFEELEALTRVLGHIATNEPVPVPRSYFTSIVPHVHERLERRRSMPWLSPVIATKVVVPIATAAIVVLFLFLVPITPGVEPAMNSLRPMLEQIAAEDLLDAFSEEGQSGSFSTTQNQEFVESVVAEHVKTGHFIRRSSLADVSTVFEGVTDMSYQSMISDLTEQELDQLLERLGTKALL